jgi:hypothetical protein
MTGSKPLEGIICVGLMIGLAGCHAPAPSMDPGQMFGPTRIPPPATGSVPQPQTYYDGPAAGSSGNQSPASSSAVGATGIGGTSSTARQHAGVVRTESGGVARASYEQPLRGNLRSGQPTPAARPASSSANPAAGLQLNGMPVNDATELAPGDARLQPPRAPTELTELPPARPGRPFAPLPGSQSSSSAGRPAVRSSGTWTAR